VRGSHRSRKWHSHQRVIESQPMLAESTLPTPSLDSASCFSLAAQRRCNPAARSATRVTHACPEAPWWSHDGAASSLELQHCISQSLPLGRRLRPTRRTATSAAETAFGPISPVTALVPRLPCPVRHERQYELESLRRRAHFVAHASIRRRMLNEATTTGRRRHWHKPLRLASKVRAPPIYLWPNQDCASRHTESRRSERAGATFGDCERAGRRDT